MNKQVTPRLLRGSEVDALRGTGRTKRFSDRKAGLLPPPVKIRFDNDVRYVASEIEAVIAAEARGASVEERQELIRRLVAARAMSAS